MKIFSITKLVIASILFSYPLIATANQAVELLNKMRSSIHQLSYQGKLVYLKGEKIFTFKVKHFIKNGETHEEVVNLSNDAKNDSRGVKKFLSGTTPQITSSMEEVYAFDLGEKIKIAGQTCRIVIIRPKDKMRYLQRYCINQNTGMLLNYALTNRKHKIIERFRFVDLKMGLDTDIKTIEETVKILPVAATTMVTHHTKNKVPELNNIHWLFSKLPKGFKKIRVVQKVLPNYMSRVDQLIVSDGFSAVSVFVTTDKIGSNELGKLHQTRSGAINILNRTINNHMVTLVGEVPHSTLRAIGDGLYYKP